MALGISIVICCVLYIPISMGLDWATLDELIPKALNEIMLAASETLSPDPNSTITLANEIIDELQEEEQLWDGTLDSDTGVSTWLYLTSMSNMTTAIADFIRTFYGIVFADMPLETCNAVTDPAQIVLDPNKGFSPNSITYNQTELLMLLPPHSCVLPPGEPTFEDLRRYPAQYVEFLYQLKDYYDCILITNAFPSYTKGVNCIESYYYGAQDAGADPHLFDMMSLSQQLNDSIISFAYSPLPDDLDTVIPAVNATWSQLNYKLNIVRMYSDIAREIRYSALQLYLAIARNYARLERVRSCRYLETTSYNASTDIFPFWCEFSSCFAGSYSFWLFGQEFTTAGLQSATLEECQYSYCTSNDLFPGPLYCDDTRTCPSEYFCSLINRTCSKVNELNTFHRTYNFTSCGIPRRIADISYVQGTITSAFNGAANQSFFSFATYWPENCSEVETQVVDPTKSIETSPIEFEQICYPLMGSLDNFTYFDLSTNQTLSNCSMLGLTTICAIVTYFIFVDGETVSNTDHLVCNSIESTGNGDWQIIHCSTTEELPVIFPDFKDFIDTAYNTITTDSSAITSSGDGSVSTTASDDDGGVGWYTKFLQQDDTSSDPAYMQCDKTQPNCITANSTNVCFHNINAVLQIFNYFLTTSEVNCTPESTRLVPDYSCHNITVEQQVNITVEIPCEIMNNTYTNSDTSEVTPSEDQDDNNNITCYNTTALTIHNVTQICTIIGYHNETTVFIDPNSALNPPIAGAVPDGYTNTTTFNVSYAVFYSFDNSSAVMTSQPDENPTLSEPTEYANFLGYFKQISSTTSNFVYRLAGTLTFYKQDNITLTYIGVGMFLYLFIPVSTYAVPGLVINTTSGETIYNPIVGPHPNPRFNDPDECYTVSVYFLANIPMRQDPIAQISYKNDWMNGINPNPPYLANSPPTLYPCAAVFLTKVLYVASIDWFLASSSTSYPDPALRYVCQRSLSMSAVCSRFGIPLNSAGYTAIVDQINPPQSNYDFSIPID